MTLIVRPGYSPVFPTSPTNGQTYTDPNTGIVWTYSTSTSEWSSS